MARFTPTEGRTYCTVVYGDFGNTMDGSTANNCQFKTNQSCLSEWTWDNPVDVNYLRIHSRNIDGMPYYGSDNHIHAIWGRVNGAWVEIARGTYNLTTGVWYNVPDTKCDNCTGIRIGQTHNEGAPKPWINEVLIDYEEVAPPPPPPECSEGARETLEYCGDGSVKRERVCENGQWVYYDYTCPPPPPPPPPPITCTEGARETLEYCPDGSVKRERVCENNKWVEYEYTCPPEPECSEGAREVLEFCPDGYTVKRERICENGEWREYTYDCPPEPECTEGMEEVLEYCPDGFTIKRTRRCENGQWVYYDYTCPPEEERILEAFLRMIRELFGLE